MRLAILALLLALPLCAEIPDPAAGILETGTAQEIHTARVSAWQTAYEKMTAAQKQTQALNALVDWLRGNEQCVLDAARPRVGPTATDAQVRAWIKDKLNTLTLDEVPDWLISQCGYGGGGGESRHAVIVVRGTAVAQALRQRLPFLPAITGASGALFLGPTARGTCTIGGVTGDCYAMEHDFALAHLALLEAIVRAEGRTANFREGWPADWVTIEP